MVRQSWRLTGASTMSSVGSRRKAGFLWKPEVLEALARLGACMWAEAGSDLLRRGWRASRLGDRVGDGSPVGVQLLCLLMCSPAWDGGSSWG